MPQYTKEQLQERFKRLPPLLKDAMFNPDVAEKMVAIGQKFGLHVEKIGALAEESGYLIMGLTRPSDFATILAGRLGVRIDQAREIASELNHKIFAPLRDELKSTFQIELSEEEFQKEPLPLSRPSIVPSLSNEQKPSPAVPIPQKISQPTTPPTPPSQTIPPPPSLQPAPPPKPAPPLTKPVPSSPPVKPIAPIPPPQTASIPPTQSVTPSSPPPKPMPPQLVPPPPVQPPKPALPPSPPPQTPPPQTSKIPPIDLRGQTKPPIPLAAAIPVVQPISTQSPSAPPPHPPSPSLSPAPLFSPSADGTPSPQSQPIQPPKPILSPPTPPQAPPLPPRPKYQGSDPYREPAE